MYIIQIGLDVRTLLRQRSVTKYQQHI